tara:strand:+ start:179 stop:445 length:267 start_codon:yes stop_codon:yes gene_type:complete
MAFKMKGYSAFTKNEEGHSSSDEANLEAYGSFIGQKNPEWKKVPDDEDILGYRQVQITDWSDPAFDAAKEKFPYDPNVDYSKARWKED